MFLGYVSRHSGAGGRISRPSPPCDGGTTINYYRRFPADYANDTRHLSILEHGAYNLLLDLCYAKEKPLPENHEEIYRLICAKTEPEHRAVDVVICEFFRLVRGGYMHKRVWEEIRRTKEKSEAYRANGRKGGTSRQAIAKQSPSKPQASYNLESRLYKLEPEKDKTYAQQPPLSESRFDVFWESYPRKVGKPAAEKAWRAIIGIENHSGEVLAGLSRWIVYWTDPEYIPHPATFLNQRRWEDEIPTRKLTLEEHNAEVVNRVAARYASGVGSTPRTKN